jgi:spore maturation protein CgeB
MSLRILYLGSDWGTSRHRADALRRLGHKVHLIDPFLFLPHEGFSGRAIGKLIYEIGGSWFEPYVLSKLIALLKGETFDVVWIDGGELLGPDSIKALRFIAPRILNYNCDDPFGSRDKSRFLTYRRALLEYDLLVVLRDCNISEANQLNVKDVLRVPFSTDEVAHAPLSISEQDRIKWGSDVVFVGTWMPERGPFLKRLIELGVPLAIYGDRWHKAKEWKALKKIWRGPNLSGTDYVKAIQCAKVSLGLLSKGNRDLMTSRSVEIPYIGSALCAERTIEHELLYIENEEAVFWSTPEECAEKCFWLLEKIEVRKRIAKAGHEKCIANGTLNEAVVKRILERLWQSSGARK